MKTAKRAIVDDEPVGIVISSGIRFERAPQVSAYVWGPAPEAPADGDSDA
jgi:hypothetical protein